MLRRLYDWTLAKAADPRAAWWLAFFAFADGGLFPFPPHPLLALMCLAEPKKGVRLALITTVASVLGGLLGYGIGHFVYHAVGSQLLELLGLSAKFPKAACYLRAYGTEIILFKAATPIPFLLLSVTAGFISFPVLIFAGASLASRGAIFLVVGLLFQLFGPPIKIFIEKYLPWLIAGFVIVFVSGYVALSVVSGGAKATSDKCEAAAPLV
ncbi:MAG: DedA family protein [Novosphingobium sp.]|nr:DedA family protein [Novosphingobium sp.]